MTDTPNNWPTRVNAETLQRVEQHEPWGKLLNFRTDKVQMRYVEEFRRSPIYAKLIQALPFDGDALEVAYLKGRLDGISAAVEILQGTTKETL